MSGHHAVERERDNYQLDDAAWNKVRNAIAFLVLLGLAASAAGYFVDSAQFFRSWLVAFTSCTFIGLGALFFVMVQYLTGSAWSVTIRRFMESLSIMLPVGALLFLPVAFGVNSLYEWADLTKAAADPVLSKKMSYLNGQWFMIRAAIFFAIWSLWSIRIFRNSVKQDSTKSIAQMHIASSWSAPGILVVFLSGTLASFDWLMSLQPKWYSTIFGIYALSGGAWAFMAVLVLICLGFRNAGFLKNTITEEHYHDLGKWLFALTVFWTYIAFSQYLLIWYANIPEETIWYKQRFTGSWMILAGVEVFGHFLIPFFLLLNRSIKRNYAVLTFAAIWILAVHYLDHYWIVMPVFAKQGIAASWMDLACLVAVASVYALAFWFGLRKKSLVCVGDLRFEQGLAFENV